jgi:hypothetical protein
MGKAFVCSAAGNTKPEVGYGFLRISGDSSPKWPRIIRLGGEERVAATLLLKLGIRISPPTGSTQARYGALDEVAWYRTNRARQAHAVAQK